MAKKVRICLVIVACTLMVASCGGSDTPVNTSRLTDREKEWVEFSYTHEQKDDIKRTWEQLPAEGVKSYVRQERRRLCGDLALMKLNMKTAGWEAGEMQEYEDKTIEFLC